VLISRAPDTAPRRNPGVLHNSGACGWAAIRKRRHPGLENGARTEGPSKAVRPNQGQVSAEGCSHHRTGRSIERLKNKNIGARLSGPCFLLVSFSSREPRLREAAAHARASPPRSRSDGCSTSPVIPGLDPGISCSPKEITGSRSCDRPGDDDRRREWRNLCNLTAQLPPPWQGKQRDQRCASPRTAGLCPKDTQRATSAGSTGSPGLTAALRLPIDRDFAALVLVKPGDDNGKEVRLRHPATPPFNSRLKSPQIPQNSGPARHRGCAGGCRKARGPQGPSAN
jgi:hypothetical protein